MNSFEVRFFAAVKDMVNARWNTQYAGQRKHRPVVIDEVLSLDALVASSGDCETCEYTYAELEVVYRGTDGKQHRESIGCGFADLIRQLDAFTPK